MQGHDYEEEMKEIHQQRADYFYKEHLPIHVTLKSGVWKRGNIKEINADFFILEEFIEGEQPIFFLEILSIEKFRGENAKKV